MTTQGAQHERTTPNLARGTEVLIRARAAFGNDTKDHAIAELVEAGDVRRVRLMKPGAFEYRYTITTWPGHLAVTGDMGAWVFARIPDMFEFFRGQVGSINPRYWAEKLVAADVARGIRRFDPETLREWLRGVYEDEPDRLKSLLRAVESAEETDEIGALNALRHAGMEYPQDSVRSEFTPDFLWICHAIVFAIAKYDERKASVVVA